MNGASYFEEAKLACTKCHINLDSCSRDTYLPPTDLEFDALYQVAFIITNKTCI